MEGFLLKSGIARFQKRFFILENDALSYFIDFDQVKDEPVNKRGVFILKNAVIERTSSENRQFCLNLKLPDGKVVCLDAEKDDNRETWFKAFEASSKLHLEESEEQKQLSDACSKLGFELRDLGSVSLKELSRSYKRASLKCHPDKGGDVNTFNDLYTAFTLLESKRRFDQELRTTRRVEYEALIEKGGTGVGLGVKVYDDKLRKQILIRTVESNIILQGVSEESGGFIKSGDVIIGIGNDDISGWPLSRVKARLNNFRVPVGSCIRLTLERRLALEVANPDEDEDKGKSDADESKKKVDEEVVEVPIPIPEHISVIPVQVDLEDHDATDHSKDKTRNESFHREDSSSVISKKPDLSPVISPLASPMSSMDFKSVDRFDNKDATIKLLQEQVLRLSVPIPIQHPNQLPLQPPIQPQAANNNTTKESSGSLFSMLDWASSSVSLMLDSSEVAEQSRQACEKLLFVERELEIANAKRIALENANRELAELVAVKEVVVSGLEREVKVTRDVTRQRDLLKDDNQRLVDQLKALIVQKDALQDDLNESNRLQSVANEENDELKRVIVERHGGSHALIVSSNNSHGSTASSSSKKLSMNAASTDDLWNEVFSLRTNLRQEKKKREEVEEELDQTKRCFQVANAHRLAYREKLQQLESSKSEAK